MGCLRCNLYASGLALPVELGGCGQWGGYGTRRIGLSLNKNVIFIASWGPNCLLLPTLEWCGITLCVILIDRQLTIKGREFKIRISIQNEGLCQGENERIRIKPEVID